MLWTLQYFQQLTLLSQRLREAWRQKMCAQVDPGPWPLQEGKKRHASAVQQKFLILHKSLWEPEQNFANLSKNCANSHGKTLSQASMAYPNCKDMGEDRQNSRQVRYIFSFYLKWPQWTVTGPFEVANIFGQSFSSISRGSGLPTDKRPLYTPLPRMMMMWLSIASRSQQRSMIVLSNLAIAMMTRWVRIVLACRWLPTYLMSLYFLYWFWLIEYEPPTSFPLHGSVPLYSCSKNLDGTLL